jgi:hypothetical protein
VNLGEQMIEHPGVLAHRTLRLTGQTRREIDVGQLIRRHNDAQIAVAIDPPYPPAKTATPGQRRQSLVESSC